MNYLKLASMSLRSKKLLNVFFALELAIVMFIFNIVIASYNNRNMLYEPYKEMLSKSGYYFTMHNGMTNNEEHISLSFDKMQGDLSFMTIYEMTPRIAEDSFIRLAICPDDFYNTMQLPIKKGKADSSKEIYGVISPNSLNISVSDTVNLYDYDTQISISGELTDPTYRPKLGDWYVNSDIRLFYQNYALSSAEDPLIIMPFSAFEKMGIDNTDIWAMGAFIFYNTEPTPEIYEYNRSILSAELLIDFYELNANTKKYINDDLKKYVPIVMLIFFIALMGLICNVAIHILQQMKTLSTYYLCGMRWREALSICFSDILILLFFSLIFVFFIITVFHLSGLSMHYGFIFKANNLFVSMIMIAIAFIVSAIIPIISVIKQSPIDLLRRNRE